jgi:hypothetical protein
MTLFSVINVLSTLSIIVLAIFCLMMIIKYHRELGLFVTAALLFFALSCVGLAFDESTGDPSQWVLLFARVLAATTAATAYFRLRAFWDRYGVFIRALNKTEDTIL